MINFKCEKEFPKDVFGDPTLPKELELSVNYESITLSAYRTSSLNKEMLKTSEFIYSSKYINDRCNLLSKIPLVIINLHPECALRCCPLEDAFELIESCEWAEIYIQVDQELIKLCEYDRGQHTNYFRVYEDGVMVNGDPEKLKIEISRAIMEIARAKI